MRSTAIRIPRPHLLPVLCLTLPLLGVPMLFAQGLPPAPTRGPDDWTHHRLVFSDLGTEEDAIRKGTLDRWLRIVNDPRYALQREKRNAAAHGSFDFARALPPIGLPRLEKDEPCDGAATNPPQRSRRGLTPVPGAHAADSQHSCRPNSPAVAIAPPLQEDWSENMGSGATVGLGMYPAKYSFGISTASCANAPQPDFVVYNTGLAGTGSQASIVAYDNLYSGCPTDEVTEPATYWAYNTSGTVVTSVVLSLDGTQVAFAQTGSGGAASLVVLRWQAYTSGTPTSKSAADYPGCTAPCSVTLNFSGGANDSGSSVFYDYSSDNLYVGDDSGKLHKFTGVFHGIPSEAATPWPVAVSTSALSSPVYDPASGNVLVSDYPLTGDCGVDGDTCGYFHSVDASCGCDPATSSQLDKNLGIVDAPLVDPASATAYVFVGDDGSSTCAAGAPCAAVFQFATDSVSGSGTEAQVGAGYQFLLAGMFDNEYFSSTNAASPSGNLYVVGNTGAANNTVYRIPINANVMSTATAGPEVSTNYTDGDTAAAGLAVTEVYTGSNDYIFLSVLAFGAPANCTGSLSEGCVMGFDVTNGSLSGGATPTGATTEAAGTSGIIIDDVSAFSGASNIYYTPLADQACATGGTGGCAIQISQSSP